MLFRSHHTIYTSLQSCFSPYFMYIALIILSYISRETFHNSIVLPFSSVYWFFYLCISFLAKLPYLYPHHFNFTPIHIILVFFVFLCFYFYYSPILFFNIFFFSRSILSQVYALQGLARFKIFSFLIF